MQNGCFCCTLQNNLVEQIISLAQKEIFNYILIESSGVSEPAQIAPLFDLHQHDPGDEAHPEHIQLGEVAQLDTCVTVIDAAEFYNNLKSVEVYEYTTEDGNTLGTISDLLNEQVAFSNVIVLNKLDLVIGTQKEEIMDRIMILNPKAKVLKSVQSKIDVMEILNTDLFKGAAMFQESFRFAEIAEEAKDEDGTLDDCCMKSIDEKGKKCCKNNQPQNSRIVDTGVSQVILSDTSALLTRHESRFGISSFIYTARRPFHPGRLFHQFMQSHFILRYQGDGNTSGGELNSGLGKLQEDATVKQKTRAELMGELMRSKGFVWLATSSYLMGEWQQAGNILR